MSSTTYPVAQLSTSNNVKSTSHMTQNNHNPLANAAAKPPPVSQQTNGQLTAASYIPNPSMAPVPQSSHTKPTTAYTTYPPAISQSQSQQSSKAPFTSMPVSHPSTHTAPTYPIPKLTGIPPSTSHLAEPITDGGQQHMRPATNTQTSHAPVVHASHDPSNSGPTTITSQQQIPQYNGLRNQALNKLQNTNEAMGTSSESENDQRRSERRVSASKYCPPLCTYEHPRRPGEGVRKEMRGND